jgi:hypothetical protein
LLLFFVPIGYDDVLILLFDEDLNLRASGNKNGFLEHQYLITAVDFTFPISRMNCIAYKFDSRWEIAELI